MKESIKTVRTRGGEGGIEDERELGKNLTGDEEGTTPRNLWSVKLFYFFNTRIIWWGKFKGAP